LFGASRKDAFGQISLNALTVAVLGAHRADNRQQSGDSKNEQKGNREPGICAPEIKTIGIHAISSKINGGYKGVT
jgi:hypothetical protein